MLRGKVLDRDGDLIDLDALLTEAEYYDEAEKRKSERPNSVASKQDSTHDDSSVARQNDLRG